MNIRIDNQKNIVKMCGWRNPNFQTVYIQCVIFSMKSLIILKVAYVLESHTEHFTLKNKNMKFHRYTDEHMIRIPWTAHRTK